MSPTLLLGPFVVPLALLLAASALLSAALAARLTAGPHWPAFRRVLTRTLWLGLLASRVAFVGEWHAAYLRHPWEIIDLRDGGFNAPFGITIAILVAINSSRADPAFRRRFAVAFIAAAVVWLPGAIALMTTQSPGPSLPAIALQTLEGPDRNLSTFNGKPTVVNLWATWCPPCRHELPMFEQAQREHPEVNFVFVNQGESRDTIERYLASQSLRPANLLLDPRLYVGATFDEHAYPTTLFFDASGRFIDSRIGELSSATLTQRLAALAAAKPAS